MKCSFPLVEIKNLSKRYFNPPFVALQAVDFVLFSGQSAAIMGPSGSGKSTLLHLMGCLDTPTDGSYRFDGQEVRSLGDRQQSLIRAKKIGFVFQSFHLIPQLTLYENIETPFLYDPSPPPPKAIKQAVVESLEKVGLLHRLHHFPAQLSGGEAQRGAIARAIASKPSLILADEPTGSLDQANGDEILSLLQKLHQEGTALVVVTHDSQVARRCERIFYMRDGSLSDSDQ